jgi:hypothetical protein
MDQAQLGQMKGQTVREKMTPRERILNTFRKQNHEGVVWQPRIYYWYNWHRKHDTMPEKYKKMSMVEVYDDLKISPRYFPEVLDLHPIEEKHSEDIKITETVGKDKSLVVISEGRIGSRAGVAHGGRLATPHVPYSER